VRCNFKAAENLCRVVANDAVNPEYRLLVAAAAEPALAAQPGQFFQIACPHVGADRPLLRRPMSVYGVDRERQTVSFLYKVHGAGTRALATLQAGDEVDLFGPLGRGFTLPAGVSHVLMVARGVGLATMAPLAARARSLGARVTAVLSARAPDLVMSEDRLLAAGAELIVVTDADGSSDVGALAPRLRERHRRRPFDYLATCGSNRLMALVRELGREWSVPAEVALEQQMACGLGMCFCCVRQFSTADAGEVYRRVCWEGPVFDAQEALSWSI